jgi:molybdopterin-dependent oxidoreductase alpha subunit
MTERKIEVYQGPAGGWGALKSSAQHLGEQGIAVKGAKTLLHANQVDGFDCPGCAWPDRDHRSTFEFCENGVKAVAAEATARRATPEVIGARTVSEWLEASDFELEALGRLTEPLRYDPASDRYQRTTWDEAFALIARELQALPDPNQAAFYTSGRTSNEAAFLYQLFVRQYGTNNFPDCSNMCHEPSGSAMRPTIGVGKGTVTLDDFELADLIFVFGQNPGTNHPRMLGELRRARQRGARIVSVNPLRERGLERFADPQNAVEMATGGSAPISSHYVQLPVGGDLAFLKCLCKRVIELGALDHDFIATHTSGVEALVSELAATPWASLLAAAGVSQATVDEIAQLYAQSPATIACWGMGITQHRDSVATIQMIVNLLLLRGQIGKPGAGVCPVRGHSNVQGDRTMGIWEAAPDAFLDRLGSEFGFEPPRAHGLDTVGTIAAMLAGQVKVFIAMGGNFAAATPDTAATWRALQQCALTVHVATKFNRSHVVHGREALVLPCLGRTEIDVQATGPQSVTVEDSMSMVHLSAGMNAPASEHLLSEPMIVARMAAATLPRSTVPWLQLAGDYRLIRERIAAVLPDFAGFNERVAAPGGFRLRNTASERVWVTESGRAEFRSRPLPAETAQTQAQAARRDVRVFTLTTIRSHDQYNTTVYGHNDRYRGVQGERRVLFIHADDLRDQGFKPGQWVDLVSLHVTPGGTVEERRAERFLTVAYDIPRGCVAAYFPETNTLVPLDSHAGRRDRKPFAGGDGL